MWNMYIIFAWLFFALCFFFPLPVRISISVSPFRTPKGGSARRGRSCFPMPRRPHPSAALIGDQIAIRKDAPAAHCGTNAWATSAAKNGV